MIVRDITMACYYWQSRGDEFKSRMLHKINQIQFKLCNYKKTESDLFIDFKGNRLMPDLFCRFG